MTKAKAAHEHWEKQQRRKQEQQRLQQEADAAAAEEEEEESDKDAEQQEEKEQTEEEEDSSEGDSEQGKAGTSAPQRSATRLFDERTRVLTQQALDRFEAMGALYASRAPPADDPNLVVCESGGQYTRQELAAWQKLAVPLPCLQQLAVEL